MKFILAICVPTHNRKDKIARLIDSLESNLKNDCQIVICDDGSTDDTKKVIEEYINNKKLNIVYKFIKHSGRPKALKESILMSNSEYIIISDDDDYFESNQLNSAINLIKKYNKENKKNTIGGFNFLCKKINGKIIGNKFPTDYLKSKLVDLRYKIGIVGDKCEVYKSDIIKSNLYNLILNETRIPTTYIQAKIYKYDFICINLPVKIVSYYKDGMSNNILTYKLKSPNYTYLTYMELFKIRFNNVILYKYILLSLNYWRFYLHASKQYRVFIKKNIIFNFFAFLFGSLFFIRDKIYMKLSNDYRKN